MTDDSGPVSPWEAALGVSVDELHPRLRTYFARIGPGRIGRGEGVFDVVGTPRRWLWPAFAVLGLDGILFPVWRRSVPFTVANRGDAGVVHARRTFAFRRGPRTMVDATSFEGGRLVDRLGRHGLLEASFDADVVGGRLELTSTTVRVAGVRMPRRLSPVVRLIERYDDALDRQRVSVTLDLPGLGRLYEYRGSFVYRVVDDEGATTEETG
jgi:hypothetical protein